MTELTPPIDYTAWRTKGSAQINAFNSPLIYTSTTKTLGISEATDISRGIVGVSDQSFKGNKTFVDSAKCANLPSVSEDLVNKAYVDQLMSAGLQWKKAVIAFHDFSNGVPNPLNTGDRYIASTTYQSFDINYIYEWNGLTWMENIVSEGCCVYVSGDNSPIFSNTCVFFNGSSWTNFSAAITHDTLIGVHQNVNTSASPTFSSLTITGTTDSISSTTGSFVVNGGGGIAKNLYVGGLNIHNFKSDLQSGQYTAVSTGKSGSNNNCGQMRYFHVGDNSITNHCDFGVWGTVGATGGLRTFASGTSSFINTSESTSQTTGALTVAGGCGIAKDVNIGGILRVNGDVNLNNAYKKIMMTGGNSSAVIQTYYPVFGDSINIMYNYYHDGTSHIIPNTSGGTSKLSVGYSSIDLSCGTTNVLPSSKFTVGTESIFVKPTTQSSSILTGCLLCSGGVGIAKNLNVGGNLNVNGSLNVAGSVITAPMKETVNLILSSTAGEPKTIGVTFSRSGYNVVLHVYFSFTIPPSDANLTISAVPYNYIPATFVQFPIIYTDSSIKYIGILNISNTDGGITILKSDGTLFLANHTIHVSGCSCSYIAQY